MSKFIPLSVPNLKGNELKYVTDAIEQEWISTGGAYINKFEENIANYLNVEEACACQSGTSGLHLSLILSGVTREDEVIVPTLTFIAAVNPIKYIGAEPVFMDCDDTLCIDVEKVRNFCEEECTLIDGRLINNKTKKHIKAIVVVHIFGNSVNIEGIMDIANKYNLKVIEDSTEALGSKYTKGRYKGKYAGTIGDFGVYSFNGNKIITTGGGGMLVAKDLKDLRKARYLSTQAKDDELYYVHNDIGFNYRMTNLQAALGVAQLEVLDNFIEVKRNNYKLYKKLLKDNKDFEILEFNDDVEPNYWFYSLVIKDRSKVNIDSLIRELNSRNIQVRPIWDLIHKQKPYEGSITYKIEKAERYIESIINIPCSSNLTEEEVKYVVSVLEELTR